MSDSLRFHVVEEEEEEEEEEEDEDEEDHTVSLSYLCACTKFNALQVDLQRHTIGPDTFPLVRVVLPVAADKHLKHTTWFTVQQETVYRVQTSSCDCKVALS